MAIFESILPIFVLVILGVVLRRTLLASAELWEGLERLGFYILFPALIFLTLYRADFSAISIVDVAFATLLSVCLLALVTLALWPALRRFGVSGAAYSSVFQTVTRWNGFIALAIAEKLYGADGLAMVALVMTLIILPINFFNVAIMVWFGNGARSVGRFAQRLATNPLVLACIVGIAMRFVPGGLYLPVEEAVDLMARGALGMGLVMVGAGLRVRDALLPRPIIMLPVAMKLVLFPLILVSVAVAVGINGRPLVLLALCGAVPTAMNGYLMARQMGGDAPLYAAIATVQTVASFVTIPVTLALADQLISG
jgi:malonate transporter and related proteins